MLAADAKILVVDDNPGTRYATSRVLRAAGFTVVEAGTGSDALAASLDVDLVVLDINLPDISGFEVCRQIRANPVTTRAPVIHLSASFVEEHDKVRGLNSGADGYLTHPVEAPVLLATVNAFLRARQAEDAMRESEAKFRAIFEQSPHGIALVSQDFVYLEVNPAMCGLLGRTREQIVGKHNSAFMPRGREGEVIRVARELELNGMWRGSSTLVRSDASHVELDWIISSFNTPGVHLAFVTDITERRRIEAEREQLLASERAARTEAEKANRRKDDFLATLSHELRTPLNAIVGWTEILRSHDPDPDEIKEGLESIDRNVKVQTQLIADLLDVSRITSGKLRLDPESIDPQAILNSALNSINAAAAAKHITLRRHLAHGDNILADPSRLQQIVWNLVTNAVKFTPLGGTIDVSLAYTASSVILTVTDSGQGISADFLPHLFDRFSQADSSARRQHGGLGIGLAIVKNLVEMHGGTVRASSPGIGKGASFIVTLPLRLAIAAPSNHDPTLADEDPSDPPSGAELTLEGVRVLVVDDDADARKVLVRMLTDYHATIADAASALQALQVVPTFQPHIIVSDLGMPGQDGYDLIRQIRSRPDALAKIPAIALTAFFGKENVSRSLREGFQAHLPKPVNPALLVVEIERLLKN